jgi:hypothetical protein
MIATRFKSVVWTGGICVAALSFYMVSQTVAAKRAELASVERQIAATGREINSLETEIGTRAGMAQIENWNARVYGLQAPGAGQFVNSSTQLVAMVQPAPQPLDPAQVSPREAVHLASLEQAPAASAAQDRSMPPPPPRLAEASPPPAPQPVAAPPQPMLRQASYVQARPQALAPVDPAIHTVSLTTAPISLKPAIVKPAMPAIVKAPTVKVPAKAETAADRKALDRVASAARPAKMPLRLASLDGGMITQAIAPKPSAKAVAKPAKASDKAGAKAKTASLDDAWLAGITGTGGASRKARP